MIQIIKENRGPSFGQKLNEGLGRGLEAAQKWADEVKAEKKEAARKQQVKDLTGMEVDDPELQKLAFQAKMQQDLQKEKYGFEADVAAKKLQKEKEENLIPLKGALSSVDEMMKIRRKGNLGFGVGFRSDIGRGDTARDKGAYETLGNSLISYATSIPIRNRVEFEKLAGHISDPSISDAEAEGILTKMKKIIQDSMAAYDGGEKSIGEATNTGMAKKKPLSAYRK